MKKSIIKVFILIIYSFPYIFFAMYKDLTSSSMIGNGLMLIVLIPLVFICQKTNNLVIIILGNIMSFISSYVLITNLTCEKASYYFKPFTAIGFLKFQTMVMIAIQLFIIICIKNK